MRHFKPLFLLGLALPFCAGGQTANDLNEGSRIDFDGSTNTGTFSWFGHTARTYFIQKSDELTTWTYAPIIEPGFGLPISWNFSSTNDKLFVRLRYTDLDMGGDPWSFDLDGDTIGNQDELNQDTDPFAALDLDFSQIPDDWELYWKEVVAVFYPDLDETLNWGETHIRDLFVNNDTASSANFTITLNSATAAGYQWEDSLTGGAVYSWTDISVTGTELTALSAVDDDGELITITQFSFPFYGNSYSEIWVGSNGYVNLKNKSTSYSNQELPHADGPNGLIGAFWDDLETNASGQIFYKEEAAKLIIQFEAVAKLDGSGNNTFQIVLHLNGEIEFFYKQLDGDKNESTVGIQNVSRNQGLQVAHNETYLQNSLAVRFLTTKPLVTLTPMSGAVAAGTNQPLSLVIDTENVIPNDYSGSISVSHTGIGTSPWTFPFDFTIPYTKLTQPAAGLALLEGDSLSGSLAQLEAEVVDTPDDIDRVEFYADDLFIGQHSSLSNGNVFSRSWSNLPAGNHNLFARVILDNTVSEDSNPVSITVYSDSNGNRISDAWEQKYFGGQSVEPSADADGDRYPNIFEYHHGTDPTDGDSFPEFEVVQNTLSPISEIEFVNYFIVDSSLVTETDYQKKTIQAALDVAEDFDIIEVLHGTNGIYNEDIRIDDRVFLFGRDYARGTIIDGTGRSDNLIDFNSEGVIDGFTIQNGGTTSNRSTGAGMYVSAGNNQTDLRIVGCLFVGNQATTQGGAIYVSTGDLTLVSCSFIDNTAPQGAAIYSSSNSNDIRLINTLLWNDEPTNGAEVQGNITGVIYEKTLYRDTLTGNAFIDGDDQETNEIGITPYFGIYHDSPARDKGTVSAFSLFDFDGEEREDGLIDIGVDEMIDSDFDGVADAWMDFYGLTDASGNADTDTLTNLQEYQNQTNPLSGDTDGDTLSDSDEIDAFGTDPIVFDDLAGLNIDLNQDGVLDIPLFELGFDPYSDDWDGDGLNNQSEAALGSNPFLADSDGDGFDDGVDAYPVDPTQWLFGTNDPNDTTAPIISILTPQGSQLIP
jgi:predicted outer membrane repeat protein